MRPLSTSSLGTMKILDFLKAVAVVLEDYLGWKREQEDVERVMKRISKTIARILEEERSG